MYVIMSRISIRLNVAIYRHINYVNISTAILVKITA